MEIERASTAKTLKPHTGKVNNLFFSSAGKIYIGTYHPPKHCCTLRLPNCMMVHPASTQKLPRNGREFVLQVCQMSVGLSICRTSLIHRGHTIGFGDVLGLQWCLCQWSVVFMFWLIGVQDSLSIQLQTLDKYVRKLIFSSYGYI